LRLPSQSRERFGRHPRNGALVCVRQRRQREDAGLVESFHLTDGNTGDAR
jgi:hypothetical protein